MRASLWVVTPALQTLAGFPRCIPHDSTFITEPRTAFESGYVQQVGVGAGTLSG